LVIIGCVARCIRGSEDCIMEPEPTVYIIDDDEAVRNGLGMLAKSVGLKARTFADGGEFLDSYDPCEPGCLVLDVRMPGMSGLELKEKLAERRIELPVIFLTAHGDVSMGVKAMKTGAVDFIEKPANHQALLDSIQKAIQQDKDRRRLLAERDSVEKRLAVLTAREREVMQSLVRGRSDKQIAYDLGISIRGVAFHRGNTLKKLGVESVVELTRIAVEFGL